MSRTYRLTNKYRKRHHVPSFQKKGELEKQLFTQVYGPQPGPIKYIRVTTRHRVYSSILDGYRWEDYTYTRRIYGPEYYEWHNQFRRFCDYHKRDPNSPLYNEWLEHMSTPSAWTRQMMTRPARAESKALCHKLKRGELDADDVCFPNYRKPHIYYW